MGNRFAEQQQAKVHLKHSGNLCKAQRRARKAPTQPSPDRCPPGHL